MLYVVRILLLGIKHSPRGDTVLVFGPPFCFIIRGKDTGYLIPERPVIGYYEIEDFSAYGFFPGKENVNRITHVKT